MSQQNAVAGAPRARRYWVVVLVALIVGAGAYWYFSGGSRSAGVNPFAQMRGMATPVQVATVSRGPIASSFKAIGTVTAINTVTVRSRVDGQLEKLYFKEGQKVHAGDLLAQIDPRTYQVKLDQALGDLAQDKAKLTNALSDLKRYQVLYKQNSVAKQQLDAQKALAAQYQGTVKSDEGAVANARLQLGFTRIVAPITGVVGLRQVDPGNLVSASGTDGLVVITQMRPISVLFSLSQGQLQPVLNQVRAGKTLAVDLFDRTDTHRIATGTLASVDNQIDVSTGTVKLRAHFANQDEALFPNEFVNVKLRVSVDDNAVYIPMDAVQQGSIGAFTYTVDANNKVHVQTIETGTVDGTNIEILKGLTPGQKVVTEGVDRLREGAKVDIVQPKAASVSASAAASVSVSTSAAESGSASTQQSAQ